MDGLRVIGEPRLYEGRRDRSMVGDDASRDRVGTDHVWHILIEDAHSWDLPQTAYSWHEASARQDVIQEFVLAVVPPRPADLLGNELHHVEQSSAIFIIRPLESPGDVRCIDGTPWLAARRTVKNLRCSGLRHVVQISQNDHVPTCRKEPRRVLPQACRLGCPALEREVGCARSQCLVRSREV